MKLTLENMLDLILIGMSKTEIVQMFIELGYSSAATAFMWNRAAIRLKLIEPGKTNRIKSIRQKWE